MSVNSYYLVPVCEKIIVDMNCKIQIAGGGGRDGGGGGGGVAI